MIQTSSTLFFWFQLFLFQFHKPTTRMANASTALGKSLPLLKWNIFEKASCLKALDVVWKFYPLQWEAPSAIMVFPCLGGFLRWLQLRRGHLSPASCPRRALWHTAPGPHTPTELPFAPGWAGKKKLIKSSGLIFALRGWRSYKQVSIFLHLCPFSCSPNSSTIFPMVVFFFFFLLHPAPLLEVGGVYLFSVKCFHPPPPPPRNLDSTELAWSSCKPPHLTTELKREGKRRHPQKTSLFPHVS